MNNNESKFTVKLKDGEGFTVSSKWTSEIEGQRIERMFKALVEKVTKIEVSVGGYQ